MLGNEFEAIEKGFRGIVKRDNRLDKEGRSVVDSLLPRLDVHDPIDFVVVMLGSSKQKYNHDCRPEEVRDNIKNYCD